MKPGKGGRHKIDPEAKMRIYIPTYRRTDFQKTFGLLPLKWKARVTFVVDKQDYKAICKLALQYGAKVVRCPAKTIAQKRKWIIKKTKYLIIFMMDDDLRFCTRKYKPDQDASDPKQNKSSQVNSTIKEIDRAFRRIEKMLRLYAHVGISAKQGNNNMPGRKFAKNVRMIYGLGYQVEVLRSECKLGRIEHREDMDYTLQLLRKGYANRVLLDNCVDQLYNTPGGASVDRKTEDSDADAIKLAKLHKPFVKVVDKTYKVSLIRKEVVCSWKKAFKSYTQRKA